jgi:hypothetical protein
VATILACTYCGLSGQPGAEAAVEDDGKTAAEAE